MSDAIRSPARKPAIVAPLSRYLAVAEIARSITFYRDVLGFDFGISPRRARHSRGSRGDVRSCRNPDRRAQERTGQHWYAADRAVWPSCSSKPTTWPCCATLSSHTAGSRVSSKRSTGSRCGCSRSKTRTDTRCGSGNHFNRQIRRVPRNTSSKRSCPACRCPTYRRVSAYYRDVLGFKVNYAQADIGVMDRDDVTILLIARSTQNTPGLGRVTFTYATLTFATCRANGQRGKRSRRAGQPSVGPPSTLGARP